MKMLWNLNSKPDDLWCIVLQNKYGHDNDTNLRFFNPLVKLSDPKILHL
jgi:hypothetical protein